MTKSKRCTNLWGPTGKKIYFQKKMASVNKHKNRNTTQKELKLGTFMNIKSERLKKLEVELEDLEQWLKLGLVPKKEIEKHKEEISSIREKIQEEKERLRFLKENGELEEYVAPKRSSARQAFADSPTLPDMEVGESSQDIGIDMETEGYESETTFEETEPGEESVFLEEEEDEEDPFSDRNRWKRGVMEDPDSDNW